MKKQQTKIANILSVPRIMILPPQLAVQHLSPLTPRQIEHSLLLLPRSPNIAPPLRVPQLPALLTHTSSHMLSQPLRLLQIWVLLPFRHIIRLQLILNSSQAQFHHLILYQFFDHTPHHGHLPSLVRYELPSHHILNTQPSMTLLSMFQHRHISPLELTVSDLALMNSLFPKGLPLFSADLREERCQILIPRVLEGVSPAERAPILDLVSVCGTEHLGAAQTLYGVDESFHADVALVEA